MKILVTGRAGFIGSALWCFAERAELSGIYHWADAGVARGYDFAMSIQRNVENKESATKLGHIKQIGSNDYPTPARRPAYGVLDKSGSWGFVGESQRWQIELGCLMQRLRPVFRGSPASISYSA